MNGLHIKYLQSPPPPPPKKKSAVETGGFLAVQGDAVLPALLLTLQEGCLPTNQLPSRINKLDLVLVNGGGRGDVDCNIVSSCI